MKFFPPVMDIPKPYKPPIGNLVHGSVVVLTCKTHKKKHIAEFEFYSKTPIKIMLEQGPAVYVQFETILVQ